jgi:hypothetical protein
VLEYSGILERYLGSLGTSMLFSKKTNKTKQTNKKAKQHLKPYTATCNVFITGINATVVF